MSESRYVSLAGEVQAAEIRTASFEDREHLVVPVVALLGNAVVRPLGSEGPEFVPAAELAAAPAGWNGRPVVPIHPENGAASANEPHLLESLSFGRIFNTRYDDGKLKTEAWLDMSRAEKVGDDALEVVRRCKAGEMVEVSVGAFVMAERKAGVSPGGERYEFVWHGIVPDHLAVGLGGHQGACSVEMGCGMPRAAQQETKEKVSRLRAATRGVRMHKSLNRWLGRLLAEGRHLEPDTDAVSVGDLWDRVWSAVHAVEPAFEGVLEIFPETSTVIYAVAPEGDFKTYSRTYSMGEEDALSLNDDRVEVSQNVEWAPVAASAEVDSDGDAGDESEKTVSATVDCGCKKNKGTGLSASPDFLKEEVPMTDKVKSLVGRLIACERSPFTDQDAETLSAFGEERLSELVAAAEAAPAKAEPVAEPKKLTEAEWLAAAPAHLRQMVERDQKREAETRSRLVNEIKAAQTVYSEDQLNAKPTEELEGLASILKLNESKPDYSGVATPVAAVADDEVPAMPDPWGLRAQKEAN